MKRPELEILNGELKGKRYEIKPGGIKLGRSSASDVSIPDLELSRAHCIFEPSGEDGAKVTDLASANGTRVNGKDIGDKTVELRPGDLICVGDTEIKLVSSSSSPAGGWTLGIGAKETKDSAVPEPPAAARKKFSPRQLLWGATIAVLMLVLLVIMIMPNGESEELAHPAPVGGGISSLAGGESPEISFTYEKVEADSSRIFRFYVAIEGESALRLTMDEVGDEPRHIDKMKKLGPEAMNRLVEIFSSAQIDRLDNSYSGPDSEPPVLNSFELEYRLSGLPGAVSVVNTPEPQAFREFREKLETFAKNELGVWALDYPAEKLVEMAHAAAQTARVKYEDRDVADGNVYASICAYREALDYLETVNPKPAEYATYRNELDLVRSELDRRYKETSFLAVRAQQRQDWAEAKKSLTAIMDLIVDREDERYRQASAALVDIEKRLRKGGR